MTFTFPTSPKMPVLNSFEKRLPIGISNRYHSVPNKNAAAFNTINFLYRNDIGFMHPQKALLRQAFFQRLQAFQRYQFFFSSINGNVIFQPLDK